MGIARRIFISVPNDKVLDDSQKEFKWALINKIEEMGFIPEVFYDTHLRLGSLAAGRSWTFTESLLIMKRCIGAIIIGLPRHVINTGDDTLILPTEYAHFEGALSLSLNLPTLILREDKLSDRGIFTYTGGHKIVTFPQNVGGNWLTSDQCKVELSLFLQKLEWRRDIFLGYCSTSKGTARNLKLFIEKIIGATVLDWQTDFNEGKTIIEEIEEACKRTSGGIFLFTKDDLLQSSNNLAAPRDNVVFEAGFFAHAKGRERILIIRETGAKMPADLGGSIYATLEDKTDIQPLEEKLKRFVQASI